MDKMSDEDLYLQQKLNQLSKDPQWAGKTIDDLRQYMASVGFTPEMHFVKHGKQEGLTWPSSSSQQNFEELYLQQKLDQLEKSPQAKQAAEAAGWTGSTTKELKDYMKSVGLTPIEHYQKFGKQEGLSFPTERPTTVENLYLTFAGRQGEPAGIAHWKKKFGNEVDPVEALEFRDIVAQNIAKGYEPAASKTDWWQSIPISEKFAYFNKYNTSESKLLEMGVSQSDIDWMKEQGFDPKAGQINHITRQILDQNTTKYWTGEGYGSYEANARGIATWLNNAGITDIRDFGVKTETIKEPVREIGRTVNGNTVKIQSSADESGYVTDYYLTTNPSTGETTYSTTPPAGYETAPPTYAKSVPQGYGEFSYTFEEPVDSSKVSIVNGQAMYDTGRQKAVYYNKKTDQVLSDIQYGGRGFHYVGDEVAYNADPNKPNQVAQTFAGKGGTGISVQFGQDGTPYFFTHYTGSTSDWGAVAPIIAFGLAATGIGSIVGGGIASAAGITTAAGYSAGTVAAVSAAAGSAVIGGTIAEMSGGDFLKGAVTGAITGGVSGTFAADIGGMLGLEGPLATQVGNAIISGAKAEISGGDFLKGAAISGLISTVSETTGFTEKDIKSTISFVSAMDSGDPLRIAAAAGNLTKLDYFNDKKASDIMTKLSNQDYSVKADYTLGPKDDGLGLKPPPAQTTVVNEDGSINYDLFDLTKTTTGEGLKMPTSANLEEMGGGQGITVDTGKPYVADLGDPESFINKPAPDVKIDTTNGKGLDIGKGLLAAAGVAAAEKVFEPSTNVPSVTGAGTGFKMGEYSADIYKDAPIKGFAMRRYEDEAGNTKYIPFIGDRAQLKVPEGYTFKGYAKGGFVQRRS